jgi:hypothetical protein
MLQEEREATRTGPRKDKQVERGLIQQTGSLGTEPHDARPRKNRKNKPSPDFMIRVVSSAA